MDYWRSRNAVLGIFCVAVTVFLSAVALPSRTAYADESCPDLLVLGSRGSGESATDINGVGPTLEAFYAEFRKALTASALTVDIWGNGVADTPEETAEQYPAVPVSGGWEAKVNALGAGLAIGKTVFDRYRQSVTKGENNLRAKTERLAAHRARSTAQRRGRTEKPRSVDTDVS
ncbi:hypothetical protein ILP97_00015 [Amycolatopsis sp. H6(2020)]|nr:hypothetical protein [Amycolatopsis sp. H6(2020)]